jgi:undecaprenyl-diphosphatase
VLLALLVAVGWALGTVVQDVLGNRSSSLDGTVARYVAEHRTPWLTTVLRTVTWLGSTAVTIPVSAVIGLLMRRRTGRWSPMAQLAVAIGGAVAISNIVKQLVARPRPHVGRIISSAGGYAFPSGHAIQAVLVSTTLALLASRSSTARVVAWTAAIVVTLAVGWSRVYLGVHWLTDVLGAYVLGAAWAVATCFTFSRWERDRAADR